MKAIIPIAGKGTRLRPLAYTQPKALIPVAGRPMVDWIMDRLIPAGLEEAVFIVGHLGEQVEDYLRAAYGSLKLRFLEQKVMQGLGQAIHLGLDEGEGEVFIVLGDTLFEADVKAIREHPHSILGVKSVEDPRRFGIAMVQEGAIRRLIEKPAEPESNLALIGLYNIKDGQLLKQTLERMFREDIRSFGEFQITDALQLMIDAGHRFEPWNIEGWFDCGKKETLLSTNRHYLNMRDGRTKPRIHEDSLLIPPVWVGEDVELRRSVIGPHVSLGSGSRVIDSRISDSLLCNRTQVENSVLQEAVLGLEAVWKEQPRVLNLSDHSNVEAELWAEQAARVQSGTGKPDNN